MRARELGVRVVERELEGDTFGYYDPDSHSIVIDPRLSQAQKRATLAHELVHAERRDARCATTWHEMRQERCVEEIAARMVLPIQLLADALVWARDEVEVAEELCVDVAMVRTRIDRLTPAEVEYIEARIAARGGVA